MKVFVGFDFTRTTLVSDPLAATLIERFGPQTQSFAATGAMVFRDEYLAAVEAAGGRESGGVRLTRFHDGVARHCEETMIILEWDVQRRSSA